jgi:hypothetical protein
MAGLVPAIHVFFSSTIKTWMPRTSPGMTKQKGPGKTGAFSKTPPTDQRE